MLLHLGISSHGDHSTEICCSHKPCYDDQWLLDGCYFQCSSHTGPHVWCLTKSLRNAFLMLSEIKQNGNWMFSKKTCFAPPLHNRKFCHFHIYSEIYPLRKADQQHCCCTLVFGFKCSTCNYTKKMNSFIPYCSSSTMTTEELIWKTLFSGCFWKDLLRKKFWY